mgnify:CR=1 FL=1
MSALPEPSKWTVDQYLEYERTSDKPLKSDDSYTAHTIPQEIRNICLLL